MLAGPILVSGALWPRRQWEPNWFHAFPLLKLERWVAEHPDDGNVPYKIAGIPVKDAVSFYYESEYALHDPSTGARRTCVDMRAGCPAKEPATP